MTEWGWYIAGHGLVWMLALILGVALVIPELLLVALLYTLGAGVVAIWPEYWLEGMRDDQTVR